MLLLCFSQNDNTKDVKSLHFGFFVICKSDIII